MLETFVREQFERLRIPVTGHYIYNVCNLSSLFYILIAHTSARRRHAENVLPLYAPLTDHLAIVVAKGELSWQYAR